MHRKSSIKPSGAYLISDLPEGSLLQRGAYSQNQLSRIYLVAFQFFYPMFAESTYNFTAQIRKFGPVFIPNHTIINMQSGVAK